LIRHGSLLVRASDSGECCLLSPDCSRQCSDRVICAAQEEQLDLLLGSNAEDDDDDITDTDTDRSTPVRQLPIDLVGSAQAASSLDTDLMSRTAPGPDGTVPSVLHQSPPSPPPLVRERSSEKVRAAQGVSDVM